MVTKYTRLTLADRVAIQEGLGRGSSIAAIARAIGRSASTVLREVRENRMPMEGRVHLAKCGERKDCTLKRVCGRECPSVGDVMPCRECKLHDCRLHCAAYAERTACEILLCAPYVCNRCKRKGYRCGRQGRMVYEAKAADAMAKSRRSDARRGIDMDEQRAEAALSLIRSGIARGLSPYEVSVLYEAELGIHRSTIYRWVERGYGGMSNIELERKVGFKPRKKDPGKRSTSHSPKRAYARFSELPEEVRASAIEMDTVIGRACDIQAILTLYHRPSHLQLALLLAEKACAEVKRALLMVKSICPEGLFEALFRAALTDNGAEFADEEGLAAMLGEGASRGARTRLFYCDPRQSQQKGACEKNHTEIRQILVKGPLSFDELEEADLAVAMSHANSNPREALCGMSPIQMFSAAYGEEAAALLDALGVRQIPRDEIMLKPEILDIERTARGRGPLTRLK